MAAKRSHSRVAISVVDCAEALEGVIVMTLIKAREPAELEKSTQSAVEGEIREFVRRDAATLRQRVAGSSVQEIDRLMSELHTLRDLLQSEGARVQREITEYAHLSQSAMQSTKVITESLAKWKSEGALRARG